MNDLAVVLLDSPIDLARTPHIAPICLPNGKLQPAKYRCHVVGWGYDPYNV